MRVASVFALVALPVVAFADPAAVTPIATGDFVAPRFSPDGGSLIATDARMRSVWLIDTATGGARLLADEPRAGLTAQFLPDGRVAFEARRAGATRTLAVDARDGRARAVELPRPTAFAHGDRVYLRTPDGIVPVGATGDRFFAPVVSPDGNRVAFVGLATGIYVYDQTTGAVVHLGPGTAPAWSPDSTALAYERTEDDGHAIVGSDLWIWRPGVAPRPLATTERRIERRPAWSPDGTRIAFDGDDGSIYILELGGAR